MKKRNRLPDFHKLCKPGQNHTETLFSIQVFFFFLASVLGYLWEVLIFLGKEGNFTNRGFLYGPWLPVYGIGAVLFFLLLHKRKNQPVTVFLLSLLTGTALELAAGCFLDTVWKLRYWDYTGYMLAFRGYICLWSAIAFGIAGTLWVCLLSDFFEKLWLRLPGRFRRGLLTLLLLLFLTDCAASLILPNTGKNITFP